MAISLEELNESAPLKSKKAALASQDDLLLRPWESHDNEKKVSIRTIGAVEAVKKAKQIVQRNDEMIEQLHNKVETNVKKTNVSHLLNSDHLRKKLDTRLETSYQDRREQISMLEQQGDPTPPGIMGLIKHFLS